MTECSCANNKMVSVEEYDAVLEAARYYVEGLRTGDADNLCESIRCQILRETER